MKYKIDNDYHIHSYLSACSGDHAQTAEMMLEYAAENGIKKLCVTDHFWDDKIPGASGWYAPQNYEHLTEILPLPKKEGVEIYFGCETDLDSCLTLGIAKETFDKFDFVIIPTTHLHMSGFTINGDATAQERAEAYIRRLDAVLGMNLPFHKIGIAHLACSLIMRDSTVDKVFSLISDDELKRLFSKAAGVGVGIEINKGDFDFENKIPEVKEQTLRLFGIARDAGCKFYLGSDAHHPINFMNSHKIFEETIDLLSLTEDDKFRPFG